MIPKSGPISIRDYKRVHGCYAPMGNPEFGGTSSANAPFELSSAYSRAMNPWVGRDIYIPVGYEQKQDMGLKRGCVAQLNRNNWSESNSYLYPGRTNVFYGFPDGLTGKSYAVVSDGSANVSFEDPFGTNIKTTLSGRASTSSPTGQNSSVFVAFCFYMEDVDRTTLRFRHKFEYSGIGPDRDPTPPGSGPRQGTDVIWLEYKDTWGGSTSYLIGQRNLATAAAPPSNNKAQEYEIEMNWGQSYGSEYPYKMVSLQMTNHGSLSTYPDDTFTSYWGNFRMRSTTL